MKIFSVPSDVLQAERVTSRPAVTAIRFISENLFHFALRGDQNWQRNRPPDVVNTVQSRKKKGNSVDRRGNSPDRAFCVPREHWPISAPPIYNIAGSLSANGQCLEYPPVMSFGYWLVERI